MGTVAQQQSSSIRWARVALAFAATTAVMWYFDLIILFSTMSGMKDVSLAEAVRRGGLGIAVGLAALSALPSIIALVAANIGKSTWRNGRPLALGITIAAIVDMVWVTVYYAILGVQAYTTPLPESYL